jgi:Trk K+ transport system NAD-binding subunit
MDIGDLRIASIDTAKSIVVLSTASRHADAGVIKTILAITNNPNRRREPYHIVAELRDPANIDVARIAGRDEAQLIVVGDVIAQIIAQTCRQSGLSVVYEELLDFEGDEIYFIDPPARVVGMTYGDALFEYEKSTVIGVLPDGLEVVLNPPMSRRIEHTDKLVVLTENHGAIRSAARPQDGVREELIASVAPTSPAAERTLLLDWNRRGPAIIAELDRYVAPGSSVVIVAEHAAAEAGVAAIRGDLVNQTVEVRHGDPAERHLLEAACADGYDHVIVLSSEDLDAQLSDARTLIMLLHLREIDAHGGYDFSITSEMVDLRNRTLAAVTRADDFIVSDRIASLLMSQLSTNRHLKAIFDELFSPDGADIFLRPASEYVATGRPMAFATVVEAARRSNATAIGYRTMELADDASRAYGVVLNPAKDSEVAFDAGDRIIVLAGREHEGTAD